MLFLSSKDQESFFSFEMKDFYESNGSKNYEFLVVVKSSDFFAKLESLWISYSELFDFLKSIENLIIKKSAFFKNEYFFLSLKKKDDFGHFIVNIEIRDLLNKNLASLNVEIETQSLIDFASYIRSFF